MKTYFPTTILLTFGLRTSVLAQNKKRSQSMLYSPQTYMVSFCILLSLFLSVPLFSQESIEEEFRRDAPKAWNEFTEKIYNDYSAETSIEVQDCRIANKPGTFYSTSQKRYSDGDLRCIEVEYLPKKGREGFEQGNSVVATNPGYGFSLKLSDAKDWLIVHLDKNPEQFAFSNVIDNSFPPPKHPRGSLLDQINRSFTTDPRLEISPRWTVARYYRERTDWFKSFSVRSDPNLGRIIEIVLDGKFESEPNPRTKAPAKTLLVSGSIEVLADHYYLPLRSEILWMSGDNEIENKMSFESVYEAEPKSKALPRTVTLEQEFFPANGRSFSRVYEFEPLGEKEIARLKSGCYLSAYGLSEPNGVSSVPADPLPVAAAAKTWPIPIWVVIAGIALVSMLITIFRLKANAKGGR